MISLAAFTHGIFFGLAAAMPIGPINVEIVRRGLTRHPLLGMAIGFGAVTTDLTYLTGAFFGMGALLERHPAATSLVQSAGGAFLIFLGVLAFRETQKNEALETTFKISGSGDGAAGNAAPLRRQAIGTYGLGLMMTLLNPMTIGVWAALSGDVLAMAGQGAAHGDVYRGLFLGCLAGTAGWVITLTAALTIGRRYVGPRFLRGLSYFGGACLAGFGAWMLFSALGPR